MKVYNETNNEIGFQAKLHLERMSKDSARIAKISKIFEEKTSEFPKDAFYGAIRKEDGTEFYNFTGRDNSISIYTDRRLSSIMEKLSDNEIAEKFVKMFKVLKRNLRWERIMDKAENEMSRAQYLAEKNEFLANSTKKSGSEKVSKMYEVLATRQKTHYADLKNKYNQMCADYREDLRKISGGDEDLETFIIANR